MELDCVLGGPHPEGSKGMGVRPTHFTHLNIHANSVNFGKNQKHSKKS